ncbi:MAG: hypothetical protein VKK59_04970 [Vampirovibrionales bacterium]|nr:hypothetical protein [Vampirovibrionales bacterium]
MPFQTLYWKSKKCQVALALLLFGSILTVFQNIPACATAGMDEHWPIFSQKPYDIYLTRNRVCRRCVWRWAPEPMRLSIAPTLNAYERRVELKDQPGKVIEVLEIEILGVDTHPRWRRRIRQHATQLNGGTILVPDALSPLF